MTTASPTVTVHHLPAKPHSGILSDTAILAAMERGEIVVEPFTRSMLGSNSIDVHLGRWLAVYDVAVVDAAKNNPVRYIEIPDEGHVLRPGCLYLGTTEEFTATHGYVPWIDGRSSVGRLGLGGHVCAGRGDSGYVGHWTLEMFCYASPLPWWRTLFRRQGVRVYRGMPIGQITYFSMLGDVAHPYDAKPGAKYGGQRERDPKPVASKLYQHAQPGPCGPWWKRSAV